MDVIETLARTAHFANLPDDIQSKIADRAMARHFDAGQIIYLEGETANVLYILDKGWVRSTRMSAEGREQAMMFLKPGDIFGDIAVLTEKPYPCTVIALEPVEAWAIEKAAIQDLIGHYPQLALAVIRRLGERILHYIEMVEDLSLRNVDARLANTLLKHAERLDDQFIVPRRSWTTFDEMAIRLGTVRDVLSRSLHTLEEEGLLRVERKGIIILDVEGLKARGNP